MERMGWDCLSNMECGEQSGGKAEAMWKVEKVVVVGRRGWDG